MRIRDGNRGGVIQHCTEALRVLLEAALVAERVVEFPLSDEPAVSEVAGAHEDGPWKIAVLRRLTTVVDQVVLRMFGLDRLPYLKRSVLNLLHEEVERRSGRGVVE